MCLRAYLLVTHTDYDSVAGGLLETIGGFFLSGIGVVRFGWKSV